MSWRDAPLYVHSHDAARWVIQRALAFPPNSAPLAHRLTTSACDLLDSVALALTFPDRRSEHLRAADEAIVRLRVELRLAKDLALISAGGVRHVGSNLTAAGRMVGGWRKRVGRPAREGGGPPQATTA
jgi:hypothetical protein